MRKNVNLPKINKKETNYYKNSFEAYCKHNARLILGKF